MYVDNYTLCVLQVSMTKLAHGVRIEGGSRSLARPARAFPPSPPRTEKYPEEIASYRIRVSAPRVIFAVHLLARAGRRAAARSSIRRLACGRPAYSEACTAAARPACRLSPEAAVLRVHKFPWPDWPRGPERLAPTTALRGWNRRLRRARSTRQESASD